MREKGPIVPGGFTTVRGKAGWRNVHWVGDDVRADELEEQYARASSLLRFLLLNAHTFEGLDQDEVYLVRDKILHASESPDRCNFCGGQAISDTALCREHALYALYTRI